MDPGNCQQIEDSRNLTRYYFNSRINKCEAFTFKGCQGNHNNFHTENMCNIVCPGKLIIYEPMKQFLIIINVFSRTSVSDNNYNISQCLF